MMLPAPVDDIGKLGAEKMLCRYDQHVCAGFVDLFNEHPVHGDGIDMTFDGFVGNRSDACDDLVPAHELHVLKVVHVSRVRMDIVHTGVADFFDNSGDISIIDMCQPCGNFDMFHVVSPSPFDLSILLIFLL